MTKAQKKKETSAKWKALVAEIEAQKAYANAHADRAHTIEFHRAYNEYSALKAQGITPVFKINYTPAAKAKAVSNDDQLFLKELKVTW
jgi:hypothetical protein